MAKKQETEAVDNVNDILNRELAEAKLTNLVKLADDLSEMSVTCVKTGLPQLDFVLHAHKRGFPLGRDVEFFSRRPESGKSSLAMQITGAFQQQGLRTCGADVERTWTDELFDIHKIITDPFEDPYKPALRLMRSENDAISAEDFLGGVKSVSGLFDLVVLDSVAALETRANLDKETDENKGVGGCSKLLSEFMRGNLVKRAGIIWINQTRSKIGMSMPGMGEGIVRPGGKALEFYASIILELTMIKKLRVTDDADPYGMKVKVFSEKNKIAPQWRSCELTYLFGKGFSSEFDYLELAEKAKIVEKSGAWYSFRGERLGQGKLKCVENLEQNKEWFNVLKKLVDGEDVAKEVVEANGMARPEEPAEIPVELIDSPQAA